MNHCWSKYFFLQFKRANQSLLRSLGTIVIVIMAVVAGIWGISSWFSEVQNFQKLTVGLVLPEDDTATQLVAGVVSGMDSVKSICTFSYVSEEEADQGLADQSLDVVIGLPADFYENVDTGVNTPLVVYFSKEEGQEQAVLGELMQDGIQDVQLCEAAVYAGEELEDTYTLKVTEKEAEKALTILYIGKVFARGESFTDCLLSATGEMKLSQYYLVTGLLAFLCFSGLFFEGLYQRENLPVRQKLKLLGLGPGKAYMTKLVVLTLYFYAFLLIFYIGGIWTCREIGSQLLIYYKENPWGLFALAFSLAAFVSMVYILGRDKGSLLLLALSTGQILLAGGLFPLSFFPAFLRRIAEFLPFSFWESYLQTLLYGKDFYQIMMEVLGLGLVCTLIGVGIECRRV